MTADLIRWHRAMVVSRSIEELCMQLSAHWYPSVGEEAAIVGTFAQLQPEDVAVPHYRGALGVAWLRGASLKDVALTVIQRRTSPTKGRLYGGFAGNLPRGVFPYVTMVLGVNLGVADGMALALKRKRSSGVVVTTFGDGTSGTGEFHESLNLGAVLELPVVYVCQNNAYSISTPASRALAGRSITEWAARYGIPAHQVDGNDVAAVAGAVREAMGHARSGKGPAFVEALTYRRTGHFKAEPAQYRPPEEVARWEAHDPIADLEAKLVAAGALSADAIRQVWAEVKTEVSTAAREAEAEAKLTPEDLGLDEVSAYDR